MHHIAQLLLPPHHHHRLLRENLDLDRQSQTLVLNECILLVQGYHKVLVLALLLLKLEEAHEKRVLGKWKDRFSVEVEGELLELKAEGLPDLSEIVVWSNLFFEGSASGAVGGRLLVQHRHSHVYVFEYAYFDCFFHDGLFEPRVSLDLGYGGSLIRVVAEYFKK